MSVCNWTKVNVCQQVPYLENGELEELRNALSSALNVSQETVLELRQCHVPHSRVFPGSLAEWRVLRIVRIFLGIYEHQETSFQSRLKVWQTFGVNSLPQNHNCAILDNTPKSFLIRKQKHVFANFSWVVPNWRQHGNFFPCFHLAKPKKHLTQVAN